MAIGKPLLVKERQGVQQSVLAAQGQPLSANVPAQKLQFADYNIGMQSALASHAVGKELANMVGAGVQAKLYIDQTKQEYQRLNLMEEWQKADTQYNADFAKAMTPEAQQGVLDAYSKDLETRTANWRKALPNTADSQKYLSFLRNGSQKQYSKFSTTVAQGLHKRTVDLEQLNIKRIAQSLVTEKNSDVVSGMNATQASYANLVKIGALQPEAAEFAYSQLQDTVVNGRANLFAADLAKEYALGGAPLPTDEELNERLNSAMGMKLDDRRLTMARETYTDAFYKEVAEFNRQSNAEETMAKRNMRSKIAVFEAEYKQQLLDMDGRADPEWIARTVERAKQFDTAWQPGYSQELERKLKGLKWGDASATQIEHFTEGEGVEYIQTYLKRKGSHFLDLEELEHLMRSQKGDYAGMNERTILGIVKYWRKENEGIRQNVHKASESILQSTLMDSLKNPAILNKDAMNDALWSALGAKGFATSLNWQNVFSNDPEYQTAFQTVKGLIQTAHDQGTGPFQDKYMQLPHNERIVHLEDFIKMQVGKVFGQVTAKQMQQKRQEQATLEQRGEAEARTSISQTFQAGGKDPRTKRMVPGAISYRTASTAAELEAQRTEAYNSFKSRIDTERKRLEYEALPEPVKFIDRFIPTMPKVEVGSPTLSSIGSAIMGSTPAGYITDKLNRQLQNTMEEKLGRPLTEGELAGEDPQVNELASMIIKEKERSTIGKFFDWFWSDGSSSDREIAMDNLLYDIKNKSLEGIKRGVEQVQPPTEAQPATEVPEESIPVAKQPPTAVDDLVKGMSGNPLVSQLVETANNLVNRPNLEAATEAEATQFDPNVQGARYLTAEGQPTHVMPLEVRQQIMDNPEAYPQFTQYELVQGDMLGRIAKQAGISLEDLQNLNSNTIGRENKLRLGEKILLPAGSVITPSDPEVVPDKSPVETAPIPKDRGDAVKNLATLDKKSRAESNRKFEEIKNLSERDTILFFEGHPPDAKFQTKGVHEGPYGISLKNFNAYTGKKYKVNDKPAPEDVEMAYNAHMEKAVMPIISDLEKYVQFSSNEKRALISLLWNGAKGSKTLKPIAKNAYKAFQAGDKAKAYAELFSSTKGLRKSGGKVTQGLVNRRAAEWLLAEMGDASGSSPATNISSAGSTPKKAYDLFSNRESVGKNSEEKLQAIRKLLMDKENRIKEELESKELLAAQKHLEELLLLRKNLGLAGQELRTGEIQGKDIENYQLNRNPVYQGKNPQRNRRNI